MKLYSKTSITRPLAAMAASGRFVHSYMLTGPKGVGKKTAAVYTAMLLLCSEAKDGVPCGVCRDCRRVLKNEHPDFITVERSRKSYSVDDVRHIVTDAYVSPNDCDRKVYLLSDCGGWSDAAQAAMLKITEDPPDPVYFIFTSENLTDFLPTLISRSMPAEVTAADRESCIEALSERFPDKDTDELAAAAEAFCGNIGRCIEYLDGNEKLMNNVERVKKLSAAAASGSEYTALCVLSSVKDRDELKELLGMFAAVIRDAAAKKSGSDTHIGCDAAGAEKLSVLPVSKLMDIYDEIMRISSACALNVNADAAAAVLAGRLA
ncbi:MAG: hypothetical protein ILP19_08335 [Oscillospiraceae bacterium]|nr:hypothetical protein [Oscillospiraceae bacterium]